MRQFALFAVSWVLLAGCSSGEESPATTIGDTSRIAYTCARGAALCVMGTDGRDERLIAHLRSDSPTWSPDGEKIAFAKLGVRDEFGSSWVSGDDIYVVDADGSDLRQLTEGPHFDTDPAWSPDGQRIAFASDRHLHRTEESGPAVGSIYVVNVEGADIRRLTRGTDDSDPAWSPDGKRIMFVRAAEMWVMNADGTGARELPVRYPIFPNAPAWSPDGKLVAFGSEDGLFLMNQDGTGVHRLLPRRRPSEPPLILTDDPAWSPDGRRIAFSAWDDRSDCTAIFVVRPDGSALRRLSQCAPFEYQAPAWQPLP